MTAGHDRLTARRGTPPRARRELPIGLGCTPRLLRYEGARGRGGWGGRSRQGRKAEAYGAPPEGRNRAAAAEG